MPKKEQRPFNPITRHTEDHSLVELDISELDPSKTLTKEEVEAFLAQPTARFVELGARPCRPPNLDALHDGDMREFIDEVIDEAIEEMLYGAEANRIAEVDIRRAFFDATNIAYRPRKKKNILRRILGYCTACYCRRR
ncbi:uncharacterized protein LOC128175329 [Crassostrea angulata]|uniref:uncharacterized protein LOC128175329 n=1 Tax=Magallana angulata TaxID=2784310 RepID=UPI0022B19E6D|nr:uncharacterized protein LOC128175329 [Crassostrea angulata]